MNAAASGLHWCFQFGIYCVKTQAWVPVIVGLSSDAPGLAGKKPGQYLNTTQ
jgi:hypothetical protein